MTINFGGRRSTKYVLKYFCGLLLAGREDSSYYEVSVKKKYRYWKSSSKYPKMTEGSAVANCSDEIKILREMFFDERQKQ